MRGQPMTIHHASVHGKYRYQAIKTPLCRRRRMLLLLVLLPCLGTGSFWASTSTAVGDQQHCENENLRSALGWTLLPTCRAYEMVTPSYKEGYPLLRSDFAANGESAILFSLATLAGNLGSGERVEQGSIYLDTRTSTGWRLTPLDPPSSQFVGQLMVSAEVDSDETLWIQHTVQQAATNHGLYVRSSDGNFSFIGPSSPPSGSEEEPSDTTGLTGGEFAPPKAATVDYEHVVLEAQAAEARWPFDQTGRGHSLYEYTGTGNSEPTLVGVEGPRGSRELIGTCGTTLGSGVFGSRYNALSGDGERIFFTVAPCSPKPATATLYARLHGGIDGIGPAETVDVSKSECTNLCGEAESGANFEGASEDGRLVFFTSTQKLTNEAIDGTTGGNAAQGEGCAGISAPPPPETGSCNLYMYDFSKPVGKRLTTIASGEVLGVAGLAENGSRIYYVSRAKVKSGGANVYGNLPLEGQANLYVYDTSSGKTTFVVTLGKEADKSDWSREFLRPVEVAGPSGRAMLFASSTPNITPDDTSTVTQLFEYRAPGESEGDGSGEAAELVRVTKGEDGFSEDGNSIGAGVSLEVLVEISKRIGDNADFKSTANRLTMSTDGRRVFFSTTAQLSPRAVSAGHECESLYEFNTSAALSEGSVHLVSDGTDNTLYRGAICGVLWQGIDATGDNVLFNTGDPLLAGDVDNGQLDIYDARVEGGFDTPPRSPACSLGSCEAPVSTPPVLPVAGSSSTPGEGPTSFSSATGNQKSASKAQRPGARLARELSVCRAKPRARRRACERSVRRRLVSKRVGARGFGRGVR